MCDPLHSSRNNTSQGFFPLHHPLKVGLAECPSDPTSIQHCQICHLGIVPPRRATRNSDPPSITARDVQFSIITPLSVTVYRRLSLGLPVLPSHKYMRTIRRQDPLNFFHLPTVVILFSSRPPHPPRRV